MAQAYKVLGQANPLALTLTTLYTVPAATAAVVASVTVCNLDSVPITFDISVAVAGAADTTKQYLYYLVTVPVGDTFTATLGITLATTDVLRCYASTANVAFNAFGVEIT